MGVGSIHEASLLNWESTGIIARLDSSKHLTNCFWGARILRLGLRFDLAIPWIHEVALWETDPEVLQLGRGVPQNPIPRYRSGVKCISSQGVDVEVRQSDSCQKPIDSIQ